MKILIDSGRNAAVEATQADHKRRHIDEIVKRLQPEATQLRKVKRFGEILRAGGHLAKYARQVEVNVLSSHESAIEVIRKVHLDGPNQIGSLPAQSSNAASGDAIVNTGATNRFRDQPGPTEMALLLGVPQADSVTAPERAPTQKSLSAIKAALARPTAHISHGRIRTTKRP